MAVGEAKGRLHKDSNSNMTEVQNNCKHTVSHFRSIRPIDPGMSEVLLFWVTVSGHCLCPQAVGLLSSSRAISKKQNIYSLRTTEIKKRHFDLDYFQSSSFV